MARLIDDTGSKLLETAKILFGHSAFSAELATEIRRNGGADRAVQALLREFQRVTHVIDCSVQPMIPKGWSIKPEDQIASRFQGELVWTPEKIRLHLDPVQEDGDVVKGDDLHKKLEGQQVPPANVLDYLLAHSALIPEAWKKKVVFFWGTVYRDSDGNRCVRYLYWGDRSWFWYGRCLDDDWDSGIPSAVLAG